MLCKKDIECLFEKMPGLRFASYRDMEEWMRRELKAELPHLVITACEGINEEIREKRSDLDYSTDGTFGENFCGMAYADFTVDYLLDNAGRMYVTYARWN